MFVLVVSTENKSNITIFKRGEGKIFLGLFLDLERYLTCICNIFRRITYLLTNHGLYNRVNQRVNRQACTAVNICIITAYLFRVHVWGACGRWFESSHPDNHFPRSLC